MSFSALGLNPALVEAVHQAGYTQPTPIQQQAIPAVLQRRDLLAAAQTGTGKTAGFTLPILHRLLNNPQQNRKPGRPRALILAPTRELAAQVEESVRLYSQHTRLRSMVMFGGVNINPQFHALRKPLDILVATPGRLLDHVRQRTVDLTGVEILVLEQLDMVERAFDQSLGAGLAVLLEQVALERARVDSDPHGAAVVAGGQRAPLCRGRGPRGSSDGQRDPGAEQDRGQGDPQAISDQQWEVFEAYNVMNAQSLEGEWDAIIVHDPQPAAIRRHVPEKAKRWIWRCHIDLSTPNEDAIGHLVPFVRDGLLFTANYRAHGPDPELLAFARRYGRAVRARARPFRRWDNDPSGERVLRVGFVSGDLRAHPVGYVAQSVFAALAAGAAVPLPGAQRRNQHGSRKQQLDVRAPGRHGRRRSGPGRRPGSCGPPRGP